MNSWGLLDEVLVMLGEIDLDGNLMNLMNERFSIMVGDGRGFIRWVWIVVGNGGGSISGVDERGLIVMRHGREVMGTWDGKVLAC